MYSSGLLMAVNDDERTSNDAWSKQDSEYKQKIFVSDVAKINTLGTID